MTAPSSSSVCRLPFHQGFDLAGRRQFDGARGRGMAMLRRFKAEPCDRKSGLLGGGSESCAPDRPGPA